MEKAFYVVFWVVFGLPLMFMFWDFFTMLRNLLAAFKNKDLDRVENTLFSIGAGGAVAMILYLFKADNIVMMFIISASIATFLNHLLTKIDK